MNRNLLAAAFTVALQISSACLAENWTGASNGFPFPGNNNWSNPGNWAGFVVPQPSFGTFLDFGPSLRTGPFQDIANPFALGGLSFSISNYSLSGFPLAFNNSLIQQNAPSLSISNNLVLQGNLTYDGFGNANLSGLISGSGGFIKEGPGVVTLGASSTFTGTTTINGGQLLLGAPDALRNNTVVINTNNGLNLNNHEFQYVGGISGSGSLYLGDVFPTPDPASLIVGGNNASTTFGGTITTGGIRWLNKVGTGTLTLTGSNSTFYMVQLSGGSVVLSGGSMTAFMKVGSQAGATSMTIQNGAVIDSRGFDQNYVIDSSTLRVTGPGTIWRAGDTRLAFFQNTGGGNAIVENGATVTDSTRFIVGQGGPSTLLLQSGATITTAEGVIGQNNPAVGTATVTGSGSVWTNTTRLSLGGLQAFVTGGTGTLNINNGGAVISVGPTTFWSAPSAIKINGGTLTTGSLVSENGMGSLDLSDPSGGVALTINGASGTATYSGAITGTGGILKSGGSTQILSGNLTYLGTTTVNGGALQLVTSDLGSRSFRANPGGTISYVTPLLTGGFLRGTGFHDFSQVSQVQGTTFGPDTLVNQTTPLKLLNVTISGAFNSLAPLTADGVLVSSAGTLNVLGTVTSSSLESNGVLRINATRTLSNAGTLVLGGGSRTFIGDPQQNGGQLSVAGGTIELNGALLVNNGEIIGTTNVNFGSLAKGAGKYGPINITDGGRFSPGNSPGTVTTGATTWNSGGSYVVEIADALTGAGIGWDSWNINGALNLNATNTTNGRFTISLSSMDALAANFDPRRDYDWIILRATGGIANFDPSVISLDTSAFKNSLSGGHFSIISSQNDLSVHFTSVPEPSLGLALLGVLALGSRARRRLWEREGT